MELLANRPPAARSPHLDCVSSTERHSVSATETLCAYYRLCVYYGPVCLPRYTYSTTYSTTYSGRAGSRPGYKHTSDGSK